MKSKLKVSILVLDMLNFSILYKKIESNDYLQEKLFMLQYLLEVEKMEHILKLQPKYFDYINNGTKRVELRLYDEKRQKINIGDTIIFQKEPELEITMKVKVIGLLRYNTFEELFEDFDIEMMADKSMTKQELLNVLEEFYTPEKQKQYGVIGIRIEKI